MSSVGWTDRDRRYEQLRAEGFDPDHAQNIVDGLTEWHDPWECTGCTMWREDNDEHPPRPGTGDR